MALFDHNIEYTELFDWQHQESMIAISIAYSDAFNERQKITIPFNEKGHKHFRRERIIISGTAITGARVASGTVINIREREVDVLSGAQFYACRWLDSQNPNITDIISILEVFNPVNGTVSLLATARECHHPQLLSMNILILDDGLNIESPLKKIVISPFTNEVIN